MTVLNKHCVIKLSCVLAVFFMGQVVASTPSTPALGGSLACDDGTPCIGINLVNTSDVNGVTFLIYQGDNDYPGTSCWDTTLGATSSMSTHSPDNGKCDEDNAHLYATQGVFYVECTTDGGKTLGDLQTTQAGPITSAVFNATSDDGATGTAYCNMADTVSHAH